MEAPRSVQAAIAISWAVVIVKAANSLWKIANDPSASNDSMFRSLWLAVEFGSIALLALFIFSAARRRNWARIALLLSTLVAWSLWFVYPPVVADYDGWKWAVTASLAVLEFVALVLLFSGAGAAWFRQPLGGNGAL